MVLDDDDDDALLTAELVAVAAAAAVVLVKMPLVAVTMVILAVGTIMNLL